jgi:hypothetical protein
MLVYQPSSITENEQQEMNQPPEPAFMYDIPSIHQRHPDMPAVLRNLNLNTSIAQGDPLNYDQVENAKKLAESLKGLHGKYTAKTDTPLALWL